MIQDLAEIIDRIEQAGGQFGPELPANAAVHYRQAIEDEMEGDAWPQALAASCHDSQDDSQQCRIKHLLRNHVHDAECQAGDNDGQPRTTVPAQTAEHEAAERDFFAKCGRDGKR